jgi:hypothetical protein
LFTPCFLFNLVLVVLTPLHYLRLHQALYSPCQVTLTKVGRFAVYIAALSFDLCEEARYVTPWKFKNALTSTQSLYSNVRGHELALTPLKTFYLSLANKCKSAGRYYGGTDRVWRVQVGVKTPSNRGCMLCSTCGADRSASKAPWERLIKAHLNNHQ